MAVPKRNVARKKSSALKFTAEKVSVYPRHTVILSGETGLFKGSFKNPQIQLISPTQTVFTEHIVISDHVPVDKIWVSNEMLRELDAEDGDIIQVLPLSRTPPDSYYLIRKRMMNKRAFKANELEQVVNDIAYHRLNQLEKAAFVLSQIFEPFSMDEIEELTKAMAHTGEMIDFGQHTVFDKHSTGGVPGNKVTLLIVPIIAASGLLIPKTSSRAITSPSGTADTMEALGCDVIFTADELVEISQRTKGMIAWGGGFNL
ncbi:MAG: AMP phosphorylase, partial [Candidatus Hodarchaeales archaeon]